MVRCLIPLLTCLLCACADGSSPDVAAATPGINIPAPSALLKQLPKRQPTSTEADVARNGAQFEAALPNQRVTAVGATATFAPQFNPPQLGALSDLAFALYRFDLSTYDRDNTLRLSWSTPGASLQAWIGIADMTSDRWEWHACPLDGVVNFADAATYTAPSGDALVAVLHAGFSSHELASVRFGLPVSTNHELWFYLQTNLQVQQNVDDAIALVNRAADAGYTACMLADSKLDRLATIGNGNGYWTKLQAFDAACKARGVRLIPSMCALGWADSLIFEDPNLIEGQHFADVEFTVSGGSADSVQDASFTNGGMENHTGDQFTGWTQMDGAGLSTFADTSVFRSGSCSMRFEDFPNGQNGSNDRVRQTLTVKPWHHYVLSFWIKSDNVVPASSIRSIVFNDDFTQQLTFNTFSVQPTQDWTQHYMVFNSQDNTQVNPYIGIWGGVSGRLWLDDVSVINAGLVNLIRRPGAPFSITSADGSITYSEGADYDYAVDPLAGQVPYPGVFDLYHARPALTIPAGSAIQDGDTVLVSGYHAVQTDEGKVACCLTEDGVYDIITANFAKLEELIDPQQIMVAVDEHRVCNWCAGCQATGLSPGGLIAFASTRIDGLVQAQLPGCRIVTWSDMYDPDHNAVGDYYLCNGSMANTGAGSPPAGWDVANWRFFNYNNNTPDTTIQFFAGRGHGQILSGYYDRGDSSDIAPWLDYSPGSSGVYACMYTTWAGDYSELENWAQAVKDWDLANQ